MDRMVLMRDNEGPFQHSPNPMDPRLYLSGILVHDLRGSSPRSDSANRLITLASDENPNISTAALVGSSRLHAASSKLSWIAAVLASELFSTHVPVYRDNIWDGSAQKRHRLEARQRALRALADGADSALAPPPPAWVLAPVHQGLRRSTAPDDKSWVHPDFDFNPTLAARVIGSFPVEFWCQSVDHKEAFLTYMDELVRWTANRLFSDWGDKEERRQRSTMFEWSRALSGLISRVLSFVAAGEVINRFVAPFSGQAHEDGLEVVSDITDEVVCRHVYDAPTVTDSALTVLQYCLQRMLQERTFDANSYRAGEINSRTLSKMVRSLLLVSVENAPGAARFANGDWSDLPRLLPLIDILMQQAGWSVFVMGTYFTLCERAGAAFPIDTFTRQIAALSDAQGNYPPKWIGSNIPARMSGVVQVLAEANHPLRRSQARGLLSILDRLVDIGDRRAAALQQSEYFRGVQLGS